MSAETAAAIVTAILSTAPQAVLAILFGAFALVMLYMQGKRDEKRDAAFLGAIEKRDSEWRDFISDIQERQARALTEALGPMAREARKVAAELAALSDLWMQHDQAITDWHRSLKEQLERIGKELNKS